MTASSLEVTLDAVMAAARRGDYAVAIALAEAARTALPAGDRGLVRLANLLGGIAFEQGKLAAAETWFEEAIRGARAHRDAVLGARATNNLAMVAQLRGKRTLAVSLYRGALTVWREVGDAMGEAQALHNLALLHLEAGNLPAAALAARRAVRRAREHGDAALQGIVLLGRAQVALRMGELESAAADIAAGRHRSRESADALGLTEAARLLGALAMAEGRHRDAFRLARLAHRRARRLGAEQLAAECAELSARTCRLLERPEEAREFYRMARDGYAATGALPALRRLERLAAT